MEEFLKLGKECGLQGEDLLRFVEKEKEKQKKEKLEEDERERQRKEKEREEQKREKLEKEETERQRLEKEEEKERQRLEKEEEKERQRLEREEVKERQRIEREERAKDRELQKQKLELEKEERQQKLDIEREEKQRQFEREKQQFEREKREHEQEKEKTELRKLELQAEIAREGGLGPVRSSSDNSRSPKLPVFVDGKDKIDSYLERFERYASSNEWDDDTWATKLSALLTGAALDVYTRMPRSDADDYGELKKALLKRYNYTEEGYRQRFRNCRPEQGETPSQFVERLSSYLEKWMELSSNEKEYDNLRDLIVKEQFVNACSSDLATHLQEQETKDLSDLTKTAERYLVARNRNFAGKINKPPLQRFEERRPADNSRDQQGQQWQPTCHLCNKRGHKAFECRSARSRFPPRNNGNASNFRGKERDANQHKAASSVSIGETVEKKTEEESTKVDKIRSNVKDGKLKLENGNSVNVFDTAALSKSANKITPNMPVTDGQVGESQVKVLRDTGCSGVIVKKNLVNSNDLTGEVSYIWLADSSLLKAPMAKIDINTPFYSGTVQAMCVETPLYDLIVGNIEGARAADDPNPAWNEVCAVTTRNQAKKEGHSTPLKVAKTSNSAIVDRKELIRLQQTDLTLVNKMKKKLPDNNTDKNVTYEEKSGVMYRVYTKPSVNDGKPIRQVLVPTSLRSQVMKTAHDSILGGHLGVKKTTDRILAAFYWPGILGDINRFCKSCDICQKTIPKGKVPKVPLQKMPLVDSPFKRVAIDLIGPIGPASEDGHRYILTLVDYATRYPEAVALKRIDTETVAEALVDMFSRLGIPEEILSDLGTQFVSDCMREVERLLSIKHLSTSPYHPICNGLCEKFNGTLKSMLKKLCGEQPKQWNRFINALLFAYREVPQESTGFSPFELLYGRTVRGPMHILKELWTGENENTEVKNSYQYVFELREKLEETLKIAQNSLSNAQKRGKHYYDKKAKARKFNVDDKVLVLLPTDHNKLLMQWKGPHVIEEVIGLNDYRVKVGGKTKTYHANLLKLYLEREPTMQNKVASSVTPDIPINEDDFLDLGEVTHKESFHDIEFGEKLNDRKREEISELAKNFEHLFDPKPGNTDVVEHHVNLTSSEPIFCKPYRIPYQTREVLKNDINDMLDMGVIRESNSPYASPTVIVKKPDGSNRICIDYRKLNKLTVFDPEPMPTADELFQKVSGDHYFSKVDLSKGYWQIKIPEKDIPKTAFVTPDGHYEFLRMPFGMVNSGATLKRGLRKILKGIENVDYYWDDILVHTRTWEEHLEALHELFERLSKANLTIRPSKSILGTDNVDFIGHKLSQGMKGLHESNVEKIKDAPRPTTKTQVRSFMGLANYYREFLPNFAAVTAPLTDLIKKNKPNKVEWGEAQERSYQTVKDLLCQKPVLRLPDTSKPFVLRTDASDEGLGAVLLQEHEGQLFPVSFASKKLSQAQKHYSTIEKECLAVVWAVQKYELYLQGVNFVLQTDHHPLKYLGSAKFTNNRLMRWSMFLQNFSIHIEAIKGEDNIGADFLSRTD